MRETMRWILALCGVLYVGSVQATPASGFTGTTIALGHFDEIDVKNHAFFPDALTEQLDLKNVWLSFQKTSELSDLYVQNNVWQPGGTTGWHTHPGHSLIIVTEGTITAYDMADPSCAPRVYTQGMGFVDPGGTHGAHVLRNETLNVARTVAVQLLPAGAARRIDVDAPPGCGF